MSGVTRTATIGTREPRPGNENITKMLDPQARRAARIRADIAAEAASAAEIALDAAEKAKQLAVIASKASWSAWTSLAGSVTTDFLVVVVTLGLFALVTFVYLKLRPTILLDNTEFYGQCPDRWIFREDTHASGSDDGSPPNKPGTRQGTSTLSTQVAGKCWPTYQTTCQPFDPSMYKATRCDIAKSCGTTWHGLCP